MGGSGRKPYSYFTMVTAKDAEALKERLCREYGQPEEDKLFRIYIERAKEIAASSENGEEVLSRYFQYYNNDLRREINRKKRLRKRLTAEDLPIVTQLFTPAHIAAYIVDNSLGRLLYECGHDVGAEYLIKDETLAYASRKRNIREMRIIDPAAGTGNLLLRAAELLSRAYAQTGMSRDEIARAISANLFGLDIDERAVEICRYVCARKFGAEPKIYTLRKPSDEEIARVKASGEGAFAKLLEELNEIGAIADLSPFAAEAVRRYPELELLRHRYDVILVNPPYLASADFGSALTDYVKKNYPECGADLFSVFMLCYLAKLAEGGYLGLVCPYNWMFTRRFAAVRRAIIGRKAPVTLAKLSAGAYKDATVFLSACVLSERPRDKGVYFRIEGKKDEEAELLRACADESYPERYVREAKRFLDVPDCGIAFWTSDRFIANYSAPRLTSVMDIRQGMATGDNARYLRDVRSVPAEEIDFNARSLDEFIAGGKKYALYSKGGEYRKWYGNVDYVIRFDEEARRELKSRGNRMPSLAYYFRKGITWTLVSSKGHFGARIVDNSVFDVGGSCGFAKDERDIYVILAFLTSKVAEYYLNALNPTVNCQVGDVKNLPYIALKGAERELVDKLARENTEIARRDWLGSRYSYLPEAERPLLTAAERAEAFKKMRSNEEKINGIFIEAYGLGGELTPEVPDKLITLFGKGERE